MTLEGSKKQRAEIEGLHPEGFRQYVGSFFGVNESELKDLINRIDGASKHVMVVMHPFNLDPEKEPRMADYIYRYMNRLVRNEAMKKIKIIDSYKNVPLFIYVGEEDVEVYRNIIQNIVNSYCGGLEEAAKNSGRKLELSRNPHNYGIYTLTTQDDQGVPYIPGTDKINSLIYGDSISENLMSNSWVTQINFFKYLGISKITATGGFIGKHKPTDTYLSRCLGAFIRIMRHSFKVDISNSAVYKDGVSRKVLKDKGISLKDTKRGG